ncbi:MAG: DinB family protein, partial [Humidesulfovibrio sp.]|nr:DinB family protein [Humidesulfovibrio sp.]
ELSQGFGVNFGSVLGIANHTILADQAWLRRFTGEGASPPTVDAVPYPDLASLCAARQAVDARIVDFAAKLNPARLSEILHYANIKGEPRSQPFAICLAHFFNHQTFHRGQLHALLGVLGVVVPDLDLICYQAAHGHHAP